MKLIISTHNLKLTNDAASFRARFGGVAFDVWVPMCAVLGIYARETGQGMIFSHDSDSADNSDAVAEPADHDLDSTRARSHLRVVK